MEIETNLLSTFQKLGVAVSRVDYSFRLAQTSTLISIHSKDQLLIKEHMEIPEIGELALGSIEA
jgi:hypothetical protein